MKPLKNPPLAAVGPNSDARVTANLQDALLEEVALTASERTLAYGGNGHTWLLMCRADFLGAT
jgi:hypothetical protein